MRVAIRRKKMTKLFQRLDSAGSFRFELFRVDEFFVNASCRGIVSRDNCNKC